MTRYTTYSMNVAGRPMWYVIDNQNNGEEMYRSRDEHMATGRAETLNRQAETPAHPAAPQNPTGWSKAAQRRRHNSHRSHPLGEAVEAGDGYTIYEDTAFGGGRVQIWDQS